MTAPRAPNGLHAAGRRLWKDLWAKYEFRPDERVLLEELCRLADDIRALRDELADAPLMVAGSKGQDVVHPLRTELHRTSTRLESLSKTLQLPDDPAANPALRRSHAARELANRRWHGR